MRKKKKREKKKEKKMMDSVLGGLVPLRAMTTPRRRLDCKKAK